MALEPDATSMNLLYLPRWMEVLISIARLPGNQRYPQRLYRECPVCSSHIKTVLKALQAHQLIHVDRTGRIRWIRLTSQGESLSQHLLQVRWLLASIFREQELDDGQELSGG